MKKILLILSATCLTLAVQAQKIDRSKRPEPGPAPVISIKDPTIFKLNNGITVLVVQNHKLPKVSATFSVDAGPITEGAKAGVTSLMGQMLNEGTKTKPKAVFDEEVEKMGANVNLFSTGGSVSALTRYFDKAFMLMAEGLKEPAFSQESFDKLKSQALTGLKASEKSAKAISSRVTSALTFGINHPMGEYESEESINNISLNDIKLYYKKYITPSRGYLTFVGDITPEKARQLAEKAFGTWKGSPLSLEKLPLVNNPEKTQVNLIDVPNAVQSEITVQNIVQLPLSSPDYFAVLLANQILGGGSDSRLFMNLREKHGFTYGSYSSVGSGRFQTTFSASAAVRNEKTDSAVAEILREIQKIRTDTVSKEELKNAKALYNGNFALQMENPARLATFASNILINNLPKDFYRTYLQKINAVTQEDIKRVANKYFNYNNTRIIVVGKADAVKEGLTKLGYPVLMYDKWAKPVTADKTAKANTEKVEPKTVINNYLKAIGGIEEAKKVTSMHQNLEMEMQGMKLGVELKKMAPNKDLQIISFGGAVMQKEVFNGTKGYTEAQGQRHEMTEEQIADRKLESAIIEQLDYLNAGYKLNFKGVEKVNGNDAYAIEVTKPSGKSVLEFYDVKSGLLVKQERTETEGGMEMQQTMELGDYRKVGNLLFPFKQTLTISAGGQQQELPMVAQSIKVNEGVSEKDFE